MTLTCPGLQAAQQQLERVRRRRRRPEARHLAFHYSAAVRRRVEVVAQAYRCGLARGAEGCKAVRRDGSEMLEKVAPLLVGEQEGDTCSDLKTQGRHVGRKPMRTED